jgi:hypothetical protein
MNDAKTMTAADLTFGIELEVTIPASAGVQVGSYRSGLPHHELPDGWRVHSDISIAPGANHIGAEIVSPILKGADGIRQVIAVCQWLNRIRAKVNASCGCHVHVGGFDVRDEAAIGRMVSLVARYEKALFAVAGNTGRENNDYCKSIKGNAAYAAKFKDRTDTAPIRGHRTWSNHQERYYSLNLCPIGEGTKPTVEFRCFSGTTNALKAVSFIRLALGIVERGLKAKRLAKWDFDRWTCRPGAGQSNLDYLFDTLSWYGRVGVPAAGVVEEEGMPSLKETKAELVRLAKKYDERVA